MFKYLQFHLLIIEFSSKKRKSEAASASNDGPPASKRTKAEVVAENAEQRALREQNQLLWNIRDKLETEVSKAALAGFTSH